jgi:endonuclease YncB( thermonuclease family)
MGRKAISGERKSDRPLRIRLTDAERSAIDRKAGACGKPASTWARDVLLRAAGEKGG